MENLSQWVERTYGDRRVAVMVSDLRGFTSTTRVYGIVHFASIIARMRQLALPIMHRYRADYIFAEADNFIAVFLAVEDALKAAFEIRQILRRYAESLPPDRQHFKVRLNGVGVHCGHDVIVDKDGKLHGAVPNEAYHIGEDVCANGNVLVTEDVFKQVEGDPDFANLVFRRGGEGSSAYLHVEGALATEAELVPTDDGRFLSGPLLFFAKRHAPAVDVSSIDNEIAKRFERQFTVLMFKIDLEMPAKKYGAHHSIALKAETLLLLRPIFAKFNAAELEDVLYIFKESADAIKAVLAAQDSVESFNEVLSADEKHHAINITGYGVHAGTMLFVEGSDIHWGDHVNTASKLGQDLATNGDLLITPAVYEQVHTRHELDDLVYEHRMLKRSGVDLPCYCVSRGPNGGGGTQSLQKAPFRGSAQRT